MKRIISACIEQTTRFETYEEPAAFKASLDRKSVKYRIFDEQPQSDGTVIVKLKKQYNHYDVGSYMD